MSLAFPQELVWRKAVTPGDSEGISSFHHDETDVSWILGYYCYRQIGEYNLVALLSHVCVEEVTTGKGAAREHLTAG